MKLHAKMVGIVQIFRMITFATVQMDGMEGIAQSLVRILVNARVVKVVHKLRVNFCKGQPGV